MQLRQFRLGQFPKDTHLGATVRSWLAYSLGPIVALGTAPILARALGPESRGIVAAVQQPMVVADAFAAAGVPAAITFFIARGTSSQTVMRDSRRVLIPLASATGVTLILWAIYLDAQGVLPFYLTAIPWLVMVPFGAYISARRGAWQGLMVYHPLDLERVLQPTLRFVLIAALFIFAFDTAEPYIAAYCVANLLAALAVFRLLPKRRHKDVDIDSQIGYSKSNLTRYSLRSAGGTIAVALNLRLDQAILPALISLRELGYYSVAVAVSEVPNIFLDVLKRNLLSEASNEASRKRIFRTVLLGATVTCFVCGAIAISAPLAIPIVFGREFDRAVGPVAILCLATAISTVGIAGTSIMSGQGRPGAASIAHAFGAVTTIALFVLARDSITLVKACWFVVYSQLAVAVVTLLMVIEQNRKSVLEGDSRE